MKIKFTAGLLIAAIIGIAGYFFYPRLFPRMPERKASYWTDPMIPGDRSDHPGKSPMGMERVPVYEDERHKDKIDTTSTQQNAYYTCPMHPSVRSDKPGACPVCGMTLVRKVVESP